MADRTISLEHYRQHGPFLTKSGIEVIEELRQAR